VNTEELFGDLLSDLADEAISLRRLLAGLGAGGWAEATPATGWTVQDQLSHICYFDEQATDAVLDPAGFEVAAAALLKLGGTFPDVVVQEMRSIDPAELMQRWAAARRRMIAAFAETGPKARVPWYGPSMSAMSSATARLMETWAHGVDVADALGAPLEVTSRLRHVADLGYRTLRFSFSQHRRPEPERPVRVELSGPRRTRWVFGPEGSRDRVSGPVLDFALVVTQRRAVDETALDVNGPVATEWMGIAQAFAGRPTTHPGPGKRGAHPVP
jgi:uncharacterized protein (TIGR03084 family)